MPIEEARRRMETVDAVKAANSLAKLNAGISAARAANAKAPSTVLTRAATRLSQLRTVLHTWYNFYDLCDPKFSWWVDGEHKKADESLDALAQTLHTASGVPGPLDTGTEGLAEVAGAAVAAAAVRGAAGVATPLVPRRWGATRNSPASVRWATTCSSNPCAPL